MILLILGGLGQQWLLGKSRLFSIWLFGSEAAAAAILAFVCLVTCEHWMRAWSAFFAWYSVTCLTLMFDWERKRREKAGEDWAPNRCAKACAFISCIGFVAAAVGLAVCGCVIPSLWLIAFGLILLGVAAVGIRKAWRGGWPELF